MMRKGVKMIRSRLKLIYIRFIEAALTNESSIKRIRQLICNLIDQKQRNKNMLSTIRQTIIHHHYHFTYLFDFFRLIMYGINFIEQIQVKIARNQSRLSL